MNLLRTQAEMVEAYRARIRELNISFATVDAISGLPDGYTAKLMSPRPMKGLGEKAIEGLNGALGIAFTVMVDPEQVQRVQGRWAKRKRAIDKKKLALLAPPSISVSMPNEVPLQIAITPELQGELGRPAYMRAIGLRGNMKRNANLSPWKRRVLARRAAKARWAKEAEAVCRPISACDA